MGFQTITEFLAKPFGQEETKSNEMEAKYQKLNKANKISFGGYCQLDDSHLVHIKVGSESSENKKGKKKDSYDVVLLFFTEDDSLRYARDFRKYFVKFFSNSPSFIYQYAALYKKHGYLIEAFYEKMDAEYADKLPEKVTKLSYDKSIYCACRFMEDRKGIAYSPFIHSLRKLPLDKFMRNIRDFEDIKVTSMLNNLDKKIKDQLDKDKKKKKDDEKSKDKDKKGQTKGKSTVTKAAKAPVIKAGRSTLKSVSKSGVVKPKRNSKISKTRGRR